MNSKPDYLLLSKLPIEFVLAVECCRASFMPPRPCPAERLSLLVDWDAFLLTVRHHRVQGLVWRGLTLLGIAVPATVGSALLADARAIADYGLRAAAQSARLVERFAAAGVPLLFVKGLTTGQLAYDNAFLKMSWDIDVLVPGDCLERATLLLRELGYVPTDPAKVGTIAGLLRWHDHHKDSAWRNASGVTVELHSRLADHPRLIPTIGIDSDRRQVGVLPHIVLPTLGHDEAFAYLCVHGASSAWFRLKWITDLAALLKDVSATDLLRLYVVSQGLGAGRSAGQALLLLHRLYGIELSDSLLKQLQGDRATRWLTAIAMRHLAPRRGVSEPTDTRFGTAIIHLSQILLLPGWRFRWSELKRQVRALGA